MIYKKELWEQSGHWQNYRDDMFVVKGGAEEETDTAGAITLIVLLL